jgi:hypothetical protein
MKENESQQIKEELINLYLKIKIHKESDVIKFIF